MVLGPLSELYGRNIVLQISNIWFLGNASDLRDAEKRFLSSDLVFNIACGAARNQGELIAFRFLAGLGGGAPLVVSDHPYALAVARFD